MNPTVPSGPESLPSSAESAKASGSGEEPEVIVRAMNRSMCVTADGEPNQDRPSKTCQQHPWTPF